MDEQLSMLPPLSKEEAKELAEQVAQLKEHAKQKRSWENAFQKWSNDQAFSEKNTHFGACGYGAICDYCSDNSYGRPCVRALNIMLTKKFFKPDYSDKSNECFENWFDGGGKPDGLVRRS